MAEAKTNAYTRPVPTATAGSNVTELSGRTSIVGHIIQSVQVTMSHSDMDVLITVLQKISNHETLTEQQWDVVGDFMNTVRSLR